MGIGMTHLGVTDYFVLPYDYEMLAFTVYIMS